MKNSILILGGHIQALGLARQCKAKGLQVAVLTDDKCSVARWSWAVDKAYFYRTNDELVQILQQLASKECLLFPTSDDYIDFIVAYREKLEEMYTIALPDNETVALFADKRLTYQFAEKNKIAHPASQYPNSLADVEAIADKISYPCVIKPAVMYSFHKQFGKKAFLCKDKEDLLARCRTIEQGDFPIDKLVIQEFLDGGAKNLYSFGTFAVNGESMVDIQVNRLRQNPMTFGNSTTYCVTCDVSEITEAAKRILALTHYTGMGEVEFMYDKGEYKFLEINTRAWKWHTISNQRGFSFIGAWIDALNGKLIDPIDRKTNVAWMEHLTDTAVSLKEILHGRMRVGEWLRTRWHRHERAVWSWRDPLPAIMYVILSPILYIKRY